jgi:hypothetical protein
MDRNNNQLQFKFTGKRRRREIKDRLIWVPLLKLYSYVAPFIVKIVGKKFFHLDRPIFIIGCPRSGTSIFRKMFSLHADIADMSDAGLIFQVNIYDKYAEVVKTEKDVNTRDMCRILTLCRMYQFVKGKSRFCNKNVQNSFRILWLKKMFPSAKFIFVVRDGRAVVHSMWHRKVTKGGTFPRFPGWRDLVGMDVLSRCCFTWVGVMDYVMECLSVLSDKDYLIVRYEDFCENLHDVLRRVDVFCELSPERRWFAQIPTSLKTMNYKWSESFSEEQKRILYECIGEHLVRYGYSVP